MAVRDRLASAGLCLAALLAVAASPAIARSASQSPAAAGQTEMKEADKDPGRVPADKLTAAAAPTAALAKRERASCRC